MHYSIHPLETERLSLRLLTMDDLEARHRLFNPPDIEELKQLHPGWDYDYSPVLDREGAEVSLAYRVFECVATDGLGTLGLILKNTGELIGHAGLEAYVCDLNGREGAAFPNSVEVELYYRLGRRFWGQGYATEACQALVNYAFSELRLPRLVTGTNMDNERSIKLLKRLGFNRFVPIDWTDDNGHWCILDNTPTQIATSGL